MHIFDALMIAVMQYGAEIWGWGEEKKLEKIQNCYIKLTLKLDRSTSEYLILRETGRYKISTWSSSSAMKYDEKISRESEGSLHIWRHGRNLNKNFCKREKENFLRARGWSWEEFRRRTEKGEKVWSIMKERNRDIHSQDNIGKIRDSTYVKEVRDVLLSEEGRNYLEKNYRNKRGALSIRERFRLGSRNRSSKYWAPEDERRCRLCDQEEETLQYIFERGPRPGSTDGPTLGQILSGEKGSLSRRIMTVVWLRKQKKKETGVKLGRGIDSQAQT